MKLKDNEKSYFSLLHLNIRSISNKFDSFKHLLNSLGKPVKVIGLTETWLNDNNNDNFKLEEYDYISSNRVNKKGGGVGIYVTKETKYTIRKDLRFFIEDAIESIFIEINMLGSKNIIIGTIYRPPNNKFDIFENAMKYFYTKSVILWEILISIYSNQNPVITPIDLLSNFLHHHIYLFIYLFSFAN